jgi:hypothetical protein
MFNNLSNRRIAILLALAAVLMLAVMPAAAQDSGEAYPVNTITVTGSGSAFGTPDMATIEVGSEVFDQDVSAAFARANETTDAIIEAIVNTGVAREDIRTVNLSVFNTTRFMPETGEVSGYSVNNNVRVTVRDVSAVEQVIDAAISAGATNLFGLNFQISDPTALEQDARAEAMDNARTRATQLAELIGAQLGDVIIVNETPGGFSGPMPQAFMGGGGGGGAVVEPGQSTVTVNLNVTFAITR